MKKGLDIFFDEEIKEIAKLNLPDPETLDYYNRMKNREIYWNADVDEVMVDFSLHIMNWNKQDKNIPIDERTPIKIYINTDGGDVVSVLNFIDIILLSKTPIITIAMGKVYSAGSLLVMAGHKRYAFNNTSCLIHSGSFGTMGTMGTTDKVLDYTEFTKKQEKRVKDYILSKTTISSKIYDKKYREDWFMFSDEMLSLNIVDKIVTDLDEIL
jgi:ATP-dependent Clp protease protease subunit